MGSAVFVVLNVFGFDNQGPQRRNAVGVPSECRNSATNLNLQPDEKERLASFRAKLAPAEALEEPVSLTDGLVKPALRLIACRSDCRCGRTQPDMYTYLERRS